MLIRLLYITFLMGMVVSSIYVSKVLIKRFKLNRWSIAFGAPFVLIIPSILFKNINSIIWGILEAIFFVMCILFFEINNDMVAKKGVRAVMDYRNKR